MTTTLTQSNTERRAQGDSSLIAELSAEFCRVLKSWLTPEQLIEAVHLNAIEATNGNTGVCHSHDHCDANQAMLDAWETMFGKDEAPACITEGTTDAEKNRDDKLWNSAWSLAKAKGFSL